MDYCSSCRRHLNGALVCPGCGAYAPDIAPVGEPRPAADAVLDAVPPTADGRAAVALVAPMSLAEWEREPFEPSGDVQAPAVLPQGRAARRRQRAQWKKNQRRAVVATAVALVGGGLTVAAMDRGAADKAQASAAPEHDGPDVTSMGVAEEETADEQSGAPAARPEGRHRAPDGAGSGSGSGQRSVAEVPKQRSGVSPQQSVAPRDVRTEAADRQSLATAVPKPVVTAPSVVETVPDSGVAPPAQTPPAADPAGGTQPAPPETATPPEKTKPQLCVLVLCIG
ncbi:hypothetical protein ACIQNU_27765 [Streptomyces sp. NPDC091292]|uniref:SCO2400 family protein n=1 Tax=Streptomyces sp. NPDC091292 TaxID=3365991 RepID=UPI003825D640